MLGIYGDQDSQFPEKMVRNTFPIEKKESQILAFNKFEN